MTRLCIRSLIFTVFMPLLSSLAYAQAPIDFIDTDSQAEESTDSETNGPRGLFTPYNITNVKIRTHDKLLLDARLYDPKLSKFPGKRPSLIFANSWTQSEYEYELQARKFAAKGYIVLAYASRGFGGSEGKVSVAGPNDIRDFSTIIDWLETNTRVDENRIGMTGVSYGGGLALIAIGHEPRIKVVASMSGWGDLAQSLYRNETIQKTWLDILIGSGKLTGRLEPDIFQQIKDIESRTDIAATRAWAAERSPETFVDQINARKVPVFLENSYLDALFPPLQMKSFFDKLQGPKRMMADEGIHASAAIPGILGLPSKVWDEVHDWMDHFLVDSRIPIRTGVSFQDRFRTDFYDRFPELSDQTITMKPLNKSMVDTLEGRRSVIRIRGNVDSGAKSGVPILSDLIETYVNVPVKKDISDIDQKHAVVFQSPKLTRDIKVQGAPRINFTLMPHVTPVTLVAYLYDEDAWGNGSLLGFSVMSLHDPSLVAQELSFDLNVTSFRVDRGHKLTLVIDTVDFLYAPATQQPYSVSLAAEPAVVLELPLVD